MLTAQEAINTKGSIRAMLIPHSALSAEALRAVIEEFVTREGTEYGESDFSLAQKVDSVLQQIEAGTAKLIFDIESETCNILRS